MTEDKYKILFVDDEALIRESISENIPWESLGYELAGTCENGRHAMEFLRKYPVDVVLTDICMPFVDGMELSAFIREQLPHVKVLILSGYDDFAYAKKAIKYGVEEYILKPITSYELKETLTELKKKMDAERESRKKQEEIYASYRRGRLLLHSEALCHTITGTKSEDECALERKDAGIDFSFGHYLVGIAGLSIYKGDYQLNDKSRKESDLMFFIIYNLCQEIMRKYEGGEVCQGKNNRILLLFMTEDPKKAEETIQHICSEILSEVKKNMELGVYVALGSWENSLENVYHSYDQAENALNQLFTAGENCIIDSRRSLPGRELGAALEEVRESFVRHVRECDLSRLSEDAQRLELLLVSSGYHREAALEAILEVKKRTDRLLHTLKAEGLHETETEEKIREVRSLHEAVETLLFYVKVQAEHLDSLSGGSVSSAYKAHEYIEEHYGESSLSLQEICMHLGLSTTRFSSVFKQTFGKTFMDVLIGIRMEKAQELLRMSDLKNYEIAEKVGFSDPHYFSIAFKKATGQTPTEYAKERRV